MWGMGSVGWYRTYSDKWCEQGGFTSCPEDKTTIVNLSRTLVQSRFQRIFTQAVWDIATTGTNSGPTIGVYESGYPSTTSFKVWANSSFISSGTQIYFYWRCENFIV